MRKRLWFGLSAVTCLATLMLSAKDFAAQRPSLVTLDFVGEIVTAWQYDDATHKYASIWQATPLFLDKAGVEAGSKNIPGDARPQVRPPVLADLNGDGVNELLVADGYGITVYGASPAYFAFPEVMEGVNHAQLIVSDFDRDGEAEFLTGRQHRIDLWKQNGGKLKSVSNQVLRSGFLFVFLLADADTDGQQELITSSPKTISILKQKTRLNWEVVAELPNLASLLDVVRVADVDNDKRNEILAAGNAGVLTIYGCANLPYGELGGALGLWCPVKWQSEYLLSKDLRPPVSGRLSTYALGLAAADINGDEKLEILVGTVENGELPPGVDRTKSGHIHIFAFDGQRGFVETWLSDWTFRSDVPAFSTGDLDGDGINEFIYNGREIYGFNRLSGKYELENTMQITGNGPVKTAVGVFSAFKEPSNALRIIPVKWTLPSSGIRLGESANVSISLRSVWATAKDVTMEVSSDSPNLIVKNGTLRIGEIAGGTIVASPTFTLEAPKPAQPAQEDESAPGHIILSITAAGGYRQSIPLRVTIAEK